MKTKPEISEMREFYDLPSMDEPARREPNTAHELLSAIVFAVFVGVVIVILGG